MCAGFPRPKPCKRVFFKALRGDELLCLQNKVALFVQINAAVLFAACIGVGHGPLKPVIKEITVFVGDIGARDTQYFSEFDGKRLRGCHFAAAGTSPAVNKFIYLHKNRLKSVIKTLISCARIAGLINPASWRSANGVWRCGGVQAGGQTVSERRRFDCCCESGRVWGWHRDCCCDCGYGCGCGCDWGCSYGWSCDLRRACRGDRARPPLAGPESGASPDHPVARVWCVRRQGPQAQETATARSPSPYPPKCHRRHRPHRLHPRRHHRPRSVPPAGPVPQTAKTPERDHRR